MSNVSERTDRTLSVLCREGLGGKLIPAVTFEQSLYMRRLLRLRGSSVSHMQASPKRSAYEQSVGHSTKIETSSYLKERQDDIGDVLFSKQIRETIVSTSSHATLHHRVWIWTGLRVQIPCLDNTRSNAVYTATAHFPFPVCVPLL